MRHLHFANASFMQLVNKTNGMKDALAKCKCLASLTNRSTIASKLLEKDEKEKNQFYFKSLKQAVRWNKMTLRGIIYIMWHHTYYYIISEKFLFYWDTCSLKSQPVENNGAC